MSASVAETCKMSLPAGESSGTLSLYRDWGTERGKRGEEIKIKTMKKRAQHTEINY